MAGNSPDQIDRAALERLRDLWRQRAALAVPDEYKSRGLERKYLNCDNAAAGMSDCADELDAILRAAPAGEQPDLAGQTIDNLRALHLCELRINARLRQYAKHSAFCGLWETREHGEEGPITMTLRQEGEPKAGGSGMGWDRHRCTCGLTSLLATGLTQEAPPAEEPVALSAEEKLAQAGVFAGHRGLRGLLNAQEFWDRQDYGTRLYYGDGIAEYLHRDVLRAAIRILDSAHPPAPRGVTEEMVERAAIAAVGRYAWDHHTTPESVRDGLRNEMRRALTAALGGEGEKPREVKHED